MIQRRYEHYPETSYEAELIGWMMANEDEEESPSDELDDELPLDEPDDLALSNIDALPLDEDWEDIG
jgi:hypothetical protein